MARPRNTRQRSKRRLTALEVLRMHLQGKKQAEIAEALKISQPTVCRYLETALRDNHAGLESDVATLRRNEIQKCDMAEREAWEAWERSLDRDAEGEPNNPGDPRFLAAAQSAAEERRKLEGVYPATTRKPSSPEALQRLAGLMGIVADAMPE